MCLVATDKLLHFGISFVLSMIMSFMMPQDPLCVVGFSVGIGIGKEVGDYTNYGRFVGNEEFAKMSCGDLLANGLGITSGMYTGLKMREFWDEL